MSLFDDIHIVGLTGQSGSGKTTVSCFLRANGFSVIDADSISRSVSKSEDFLREVKVSFPECILNGWLDRRKMASAVFKSSEKLKKYTDIIYPYITKEFFRTVYDIKSNGEKIVVFDAPVLFESGLDRVCDAIISVTAPLDVKIKRLLERDGIPVEMVYSRLGNQKSEKYFRDNSDYLIINDGDLSNLEDEVNMVSEKIKERFND